jgi:hypothetical protein
MHDKFMTRPSSCSSQIINLDENAGLQTVISTINVRRQTSTAHLTLCGQKKIDTRDHSSYTPIVKKQCASPTKQCCKTCVKASVPSVSALNAEILPPLIDKDGSDGQSNRPTINPAQSNSLPL